MGQTCVCANRIMVQDGVYDEFANRFKIAVMKLKGDSVPKSNAIDVTLCHLSFFGVLSTSLTAKPAISFILSQFVISDKHWGGIYRLKPSDSHEYSIFDAHAYAQSGMVPNRE
jgi:hypothetical protein